MVRFSAFILMLTFVISCNYGTDDRTLKSGAFLQKLKDEPQFIDSLYLIIQTHRVPKYKYETIVRLIENVDQIKDSTQYAKANNIIAAHYILSRDWDKVYFYLGRAREMFKAMGDWPTTMEINKNIARVYRQQERYTNIEKLLKSNIKEIKDKKITTYGELYPLHELAVHYSYDIGNHKEAVKYGKLFYERLAFFDSLNIQDPYFLDIKNLQRDVIDLCIGVSYTKLGKLKDAKFYLDKAFASYTRRGDLEKLTRIHKGYVDFYIQTKDYDKLVYHKNEFFNITNNHNIALSKDEKNITRLQLKSWQDDEKLEELKEENNKKIMMLYGIIITILTLGIFQLYSSKLRREKSEVARQLQKQYEFNEFKTNLLITVAHEIRTPMTLILGYIQLISESKFEPKVFNVYFNKIKNSCENVLGNMSDIINLLKQGKSNDHVKFEEINVTTFLRGLYSGFEGMAKIKHINLQYTFSISKNHVLITDSNILKGLINNLIVNAIKYSHSNSSIKMDVSHCDETLTIKIKDHGIGISKKDQSRIFDKFKRISTDKPIDGFGIGLAIVANYTKKLEGDITVESILGEGSTFILKLPNKLPISAEIRTDENKLELNKTQPKISNSGGLNNVLIVEDNLEMTNYYKHILKPNFNCTFAFNGLEALNILQNKKFDIIISDVMMPEMNGIELKEKLRTQLKHNDTPYILVTALDEVESKVKAFDIGVDDYIIKPFNKSELIARANSLLRNKKNREQWLISTNNQTVDIEKNADTKTVKKLHKIVLNNISNEEFGVKQLANEIGLSKSQLVRVSKKLTGLSPVEFILEVRLLEAYKKIKNKEESDINNVRYAVGIKSASYFSTRFKRRFGMNPTTLSNTHKRNKINITSL